MSHLHVNIITRNTYM